MALPGRLPCPVWTPNPPVLGLCTSHLDGGFSLMVVPCLPGRGNATFNTEGEARNSNALRSGGWSAGGKGERGGVREAPPFAGPCAARTRRCAGLGAAGGSRGPGHGAPRHRARALFPPPGPAAGAGCARGAAAAGAQHVGLPQGGGDRWGLRAGARLQVLVPRLLRASPAGRRAGAGFCAPPGRAGRCPRRSVPCLGPRVQAVVGPSGLGWVLPQGSSHKGSGRC